MPPLTRLAPYRRLGPDHGRLSAPRCRSRAAQGRALGDVPTQTSSGSANVRVGCGAFSRLGATVTMKARHNSPPPDGYVARLAMTSTCSAAFERQAASALSATE